MAAKFFFLIQAVFLSVCLFPPAVSCAHSAICTCYDNGNGTVTCEGGFSDGSSASGVRIFVRQADNETLIRGKMDKDGEFTFDKPKVEYKVVFDAGPGHQMTIKGNSITE